MAGALIRFLQTADQLIEIILHHLLIGFRRIIIVVIHQLAAAFDAISHAIAAERRSSFAQLLIRLLLLLSHAACRLVNILLQVVDFVGQRVLALIHLLLGVSVGLSRGLIVALVATRHLVYIFSNLLLFLSRVRGALLEVFHRLAAACLLQLLQALRRFFQFFLRLQALRDGFALIIAL